MGMEYFLNAFFEQKTLLIQKKLFEQETLNELKAKRIEGGHGAPFWHQPFFEKTPSTQKCIADSNI